MTREREREREVVHYLQRSLSPLPGRANPFMYISSSSGRTFEEGDGERGKLVGPRVGVSLWSTCQYRISDGGLRLI